MKTVQFDESQICNLKEIAQSLFDDETDPRSNSYKRILVRPKINWLIFISWLLIPVVLIFLLNYVYGIINLKVHYKLLIIIIALFLYICLTAKSITLFAIKVYQRYAPDAVRLKCRFEPSCSEYMILSIQKYGLIKGLNLGIKRLKRCNIDGGGFDYP